MNGAMRFAGSRNVSQDMATDSWERFDVVLGPGGPRATVPAMLARPAQAPVRLSPF